MAHLIISWLVLTLSVWLTSVILPGFEVKGFGGALRIAAIFGILNWAIGSLIFGVLVVATLSLAYFLAFITRVVVNAILLKITDAVSDSLSIRSFWHAVLAAIIMSGIGTLAERLLHLH